MLFLYILNRIGYKIVHLTFSHITTGNMLKVSFFCLLHQNIFKPSEIF